MMFMNIDLFIKKNELLLMYNNSFFLFPDFASYLGTKQIFLNGSLFRMNTRILLILILSVLLLYQIQNESSR